MISSNEQGVLFGNKDAFAIELGFTRTPQKYKLCFWAKRTKMGSFTKGGELKYAIRAFKEFNAHKEAYYLPVFEKMTPAQINAYLVNDLFALGKSRKSENIAEYEKRKKVHLFFGSQFSNDGSIIIQLFKNDFVVFIYTPFKTRKTKEYPVAYEDFFKTWEAFINYASKNALA